MDFSAKTVQIPEYVRRLNETLNQRDYPQALASLYVLEVIIEDLKRLIAHELEEAHRG